MPKAAPDGGGCESSQGWSRPDVSLAESSPRGRSGAASPRVRARGGFSTDTDRLPHRGDGSPAVRRESASPDPAEASPAGRRKPGAGGSRPRSHSAWSVGPAGPWADRTDAFLARTVQVEAPAPDRRSPGQRHGASFRSELPSGCKRSTRKSDTVTDIEGP